LVVVRAAATLTLSLEEELARLTVVVWQLLPEPRLLIKVEVGMLL
jgi:hypothetical protein